VLSLGQAEEFYRRFCQEQFVNPKTGEVDPAREMQVVAGACEYDPELSCFHPREARITVLFGSHPVPHRHSQFGVRPPRSTKNVNPTLRNVTEQQPFVPWEKAGVVAELRDLVARHLGKEPSWLDHANANLYYTVPKGKSKLGEHQDGDDDPDSEECVAATLTLGLPNSQRVYKVTKTSQEHPDLPANVSIELRAGSLNVLGRKTNKAFKHGMARTDRKSATPRLSINFRHSSAAMSEMEVEVYVF